MTRAPLAFWLAMLIGCADPIDGDGADAGPDGKADSSGGDLVVADGTLGVWESMPAMPHARANHCAVALRSSLYVIGGNYKPPGQDSFVTSDQVHAMPLGSSGPVGQWSLASTTPSPVRECAAATDGKRVLIIGGLWDDAADQGKVWAAERATDGSLGPWQAIGSLPAGIFVLSTSAWVSHGRLFLLHSLLPNSGDVTRILSAPLTVDGLGEWRDAPIHREFRGRPQIAATDSEVYLLGGYRTGNEVVAASRFARLDGGDIAPGIDIAPLPAPTAFGDAIAVGGAVFVLGGRPSLFSGSSAAVRSAKVDGDGVIGAWTELPAMPAPRTNFRAVLAGDFVYVLGGGNDGPGQDTAWFSRWGR